VEAVPFHFLCNLGRGKTSSSAFGSGRSHATSRIYYGAVRPWIENICKAGVAMRKCLRRAVLIAAVIYAALLPLAAQHDHPVPEKLGSVDFSTTCAASVQSQFNRSVALLHSFAYSESEKSFRGVLDLDPTCAMAHWGIAMSYYHQLWEPPLNAASYAKGAAELAQVAKAQPRSERESSFLAALNIVYSNSDKQSLRERMLAYEGSMAEIAKANPRDTETQVFYALALISTAPPTDKTHANQKKAVALLEPLYAANPQHPGIAHYLIHACDNAEMASQGLKAAQDYSKIAASTPHALHMPSHIFTRLGMWNESVASNQAARRAAREHGDVGEELHAMDYLTYAFLQLGRNDDAAAVVEDLRQMSGLQGQQFKVGYAATAMPVRLAVERRNWQAAAAIDAASNTPPEVNALAIWARAIGLARLGRSKGASGELQHLRETEQQLRSSGRGYWADQVAIEISESNAWIALAEGDEAFAKKRMTEAAELEDSIEKLPLTPGPIVPAREQLGDLLLELKQPDEALKQFEASLQQSPGRRNALLGARTAAELSKNQAKSELYAAELRKLPER
jgi:tetratricopeptide (TPR) repeat protein